MTCLGGELDSATDTLGEVQVTLVGTSLDGVVEVAGVGCGRHVELVLLGKEPGVSLGKLHRRGRTAGLTHFLMVVRETPARASSGLDLMHS